MEITIRFRKDDEQKAIEYMKALIEDHIVPLLRESTYHPIKYEIKTKQYKPKFKRLNNKQNG